MAPRGRRRLARPSGRVGLTHGTVSEFGGAERIVNIGDYAVSNPPSNLLERLSSIVNLAAGVAVVAVGLVVVWRAFTPPPIAPETPAPATEIRTLSVPTQPISLDSLISKGSEAARVVIIEYGDLECPACARFARETLPSLVEKYVDTGRARFGFRHFPLPNHRIAKAAAAVAHCAGQRGQFWAVYDAFMQATSKPDEAFLWGVAQSVGLDQDHYRSCLEGESALMVQREFDDARKLQFTGTPTFLIGAVQSDGWLRAIARLNGARPLVDFEAAIAQAEAAPAVGTTPGTR